MRSVTAIALMALMISAGDLTAQKSSGEKEKGKPAAQAKERGKAEPAGQQKAQRGKAEAPGQQKAQGAKAVAPGQQKARGNSDRGSVVRAASTSKRGNGRVQAARLRSGLDALAPDVRALERSPRANDRMVAGAAARAQLRGVDGGAFVVRRTADRVRVLNQRGAVLLDLNDARARDLGEWRMQRVDRARNGNGPPFCRSGAGHPQWGREWCIEKGWGLGDDDDGFWSRTRVDDVIFDRRPDVQRMDRGTLLDVLGDVVLGRLALHALTLGLTEPLSGTWVAEPDAPYVLRINAGDAPVGELVDLDRDNRADVLLVRHEFW